MIMMTWSGIPVECAITYVILGLMISDHDDMERSSSGVSDNLPDPWTLISDHDDMERSSNGVSDNLPDP